MVRRRICWGRMILAVVILTLLLTGFIWASRWFGWFAPAPLSAKEAEEKFGIERVLSPVDYNQNGIDDYTDILLGARQDAQNRPKYSAAYYNGGYPPEGEGCCADLVWRAFQNAGYSLKDLVDQDIAAHPEDYPATNGQPDPNIDFRRVRNLKVYFTKYAESLTLDLNEIEQWQPGDIVTFDKPGHIGIVSDQRNQKGVPYLLHNAGQPNREEDALGRYRISGHFRFHGENIERGS